MKKQSSYIIPFKKRGKFGVALTVLATAILGAVTVLVWWAISGGTHDIVSIMTAIAITVGFGCSLTALITGRMEWILLGYWLPY